jgi:hypothetical protein
VKSTMPALLTMAALCSCTSGQDSSSTPAQPQAAVVEVSVGRTPGKPMALPKPDEPAEQVAARKTKKGFELVVTRNVGMDAKDYTQKTVELTAAEWEAVLAVVEEHGLRTWKPKPSSGKTFDWGEARLSVKTSKATHAQKWIKPLDNDSAADALFKHLAKLSKAKVEKTQLYYLK